MGLITEALTRNGIRTGKGCEMLDKDNTWSQRLGGQTQVNNRARDACIKFTPDGVR